MSSRKRDDKRERIKQGRESDPSYRERRARRRWFRRYMRLKEDEVMEHTIDAKHPSEQSTSGFCGMVQHLRENRDVEVIITVNVDGVAVAIPAYVAIGIADALSDQALAKTVFGHVCDLAEDLDTASPSGRCQETPQGGDDG